MQGCVWPYVCCEYRDHVVQELDLRHLILGVVAIKANPKFDVDLKRLVWEVRGSLIAKNEWNSY